jgi:hypothetical protein
MTEPLRGSTPDGRPARLLGSDEVDALQRQGATLLDDDDTEDTEDSDDRRTD